MKKHLVILPLAMMAFIFIASPQNASAHETHIYKIGDKFYKFVVGSLNEPVTVDDATGVDLQVNLSDGPHVEEAGYSHEAEEAAVEGLDQTLKVELSAGDKKKTLDLRPKFRSPGQYTAKFYPTVQTTYTYRFFGTLNNVPVDLSFSCNPAGHPKTEDDKSEVKISDKVTRTFKRGAFGCPTAKADLGFPEQSASIYDIQNEVALTKSELSQIQAKADSAKTFGVAGIIIGLLGLVAGAGAWMKRKV